jgi:hypothetical protein
VDPGLIAFFEKGEVFFGLEKGAVVGADGLV